MRLAGNLWSDLTATPWRPHGRTPGEGLDCYGVAAEVYRRMGVGLPARPDVAVGWRKVERPEVGSLVLMTHEGRSHCGVVLGDDGLLHSTKEAGCCVTSLSAADAAGLVSGYFWPDGAAAPIDEVEPGTVVWLNAITGERKVERMPFGWAAPSDPYHRVIYSTEDTCVVVVSPGEPTAVVGLILAVVSFILQRALAPKPPAAERAEISSPNYDLSGFLSNTAGVGALER